MKRIRLKIIGEPDKDSIYTQRKSYDFFLKPGYRISFKSLTTLHKHIRRVNKELNEVLHELNHVYTDLYVMYRSMWFYFYDETNKSNHLGLESKLAGYFSDANRAMDLSVSKTSGPNGHAFAFRFLEQSAQGLYLCVDILDKMAETRSDHAARYRLQGYRSRIEIILGKLDCPV